MQICILLGSVLGDFLWNICMSSCGDCEVLFVAPASWGLLTMFCIFAGLQDFVQRRQHDTYY